MRKIKAKIKLQADLGNGLVWLEAGEIFEADDDNADFLLKAGYAELA